MCNWHSVDILASLLCFYSLGHNIRTMRVSPHLCPDHDGSSEKCCLRVSWLGNSGCRADIISFILSRSTLK